MPAPAKKLTFGLTPQLLVALVCLVSYLALITPFAGYMRQKPFMEKLGHYPKAEFMQLVSADQKQLVGESLMLDVLMYFGGLVDKDTAKVKIAPDYQAMSRLLHATVKLDPYNMDAYYFAQSVLVWDVQQVKLANALLENGMKYRTWDWYLPFFVGFNYAYFLKDYANAGKYYMRAGELTGNALFANLAGRYLNESGQSELAVAYLRTMLQGATNEAVKKSLSLRLKALEAVLSIETARDAFKREKGRLPESIQTLVASGYLRQVPADPYRGTFYLDQEGKVKTTSDFVAPKTSSKAEPLKGIPNERH